MTISDLYQDLFGKGAIQDGDVIEMAEHQRVGGLSTGQGYKAVGILNASGSLVSDFGGSSSALATVTAVQGPAGAVPWLVTMATLYAVVNTSASSGGLVAGGSLTAYQGSAPWSMTNAGGSLTVYPGNVPNTVGWLVTMATISSIGTVSALGIGTVGPQKAEDVAHATGDMGIAVWGVRNASLATLSSADLDYIPFSLHSDGTQYVMHKAFNAITTCVSASATAITILSANPQRKSASFYNNSTSILYLKHGP